jgi:predicted transcriptional regulator
VATAKPIELATEIVSAFVSNNSLPRGELAPVIEAVHAAIRRLAAGAEVAPVIAEPLVPVVSIRKSITPDYLICLDDGKRFKSLRRHLATLGMTPEQYRAKWDLPSTYPMVAPAYAAQRSALAKSSGLGQLRWKSFAARSPAPEPTSIAESDLAAAPPAGVETIEGAAPKQATSAKSRAKPKSRGIAASPEESAKGKPGRPRKGKA